MRKYLALFMGVCLTLSACKQDSSDFVAIHLNLEHAESQVRWEILGVNPQISVVVYRLAHLLLQSTYLTVKPVQLLRIIERVKINLPQTLIVYIILLINAENVVINLLDALLDIVGLTTLAERTRNQQTQTNQDFSHNQAVLRKDSKKDRP